jgi:hypothetical protein
MSDEPKKHESAPEAKTELSGESLPASELDKAVGGAEALSLPYGTIKWTYTQQKPD